MAKRMLIDATHPEETRVVVVNGNRLEEFDFETASKKQLKGNIYLAKVTRVEPSLQAAFVEYGGNRHGFLAFSEIHPDYYRIPVADREALIAQEGAALRGPLANGEDDEDSGPDHGANGHTAGDPQSDESEARDGSGEAEAFGADPRYEAGEEPAPPSGPVEVLGGDEVEEASSDTASRRPRRSYKIQEVIKRRQIMLVQVTKEERGNKGAALTTYLSLAGRYCVLMPNTPRGGGISRKISSPKDRKRLKAILDDLLMPEGMAVILRTAGLERTKAEIKRDLDYLVRLWDSIRELTLQSTAPALINEEANLIKRAIRDLYAKEIDEIQVAGEEGYRTAKDFMRMLMPSHAKKVQLYKDSQIPLFHRYQVESQIDAMHSPVVQLRSGGYLVINSTEALVAIDVNSGRATRERNIEETAYRTNLEAADEVARQLRLRDLAGLIVIDFIDMEDDRHNAAVERRLKEAMKTDRARIQLGRISPFGLLELSRQRLRPSLVETHFEPCVQCHGTGLVRSIGSASLHILRTIEEEGIRKRAGEITVRAPSRIALYILNHKRDALMEIEQRYGFRVILEGDDTLISPNFEMERSRGRVGIEEAPVVDAMRILAESEDVAVDEAEVEEEEAETEEAAAPPRPQEGEAEGEDRRGRRRRRRPRRRRREDEAQPSQAEAAEASEAEASESEASEADEDEDETSEERAAADGESRAEEEDGERRRRRGRRGGRRRGARRRDEAEGSEGAEPVAEIAADTEGENAAEDPAETEPVAAARDDADVDVSPKHAPPEAEVSGSLETVTGEPAPEAVAEAPPAGEPAPKRRRTRKAKVVEAETAAEPDAEAAPSEAAAEPAPARKPRTRRKKAEVAPEAPETAQPAADTGPVPEVAETAAAEAEAELPAESVVPAAVGTALKDGMTEDEAKAEPADAPPSTNGAAKEEEPAPAVAEQSPEDAGQPRPATRGRKGWWQRLLNE